MARPLVIGVTVSGGPAGDEAYHVHLGPGGPEVRAGVAPDATIQITTDHATAAAIAAGEESAQSAFMAGRLRVGGDLGAMVDATPAVQAASEIFTVVRPPPA